MANTVRYAKLVNLGNYENERLELEAELLPGETRAEVYERLRGEVHQLLFQVDELPDRKHELRDIQRQISDARDTLGKIYTQTLAVVERYREVRHLLERHGVTVESLPAHLDPFSAPDPDDPQPVPATSLFDDDDKIGL